MAALTVAEQAKADEATKIEETRLAAEAAAVKLDAETKAAELKILAGTPVPEVAKVEVFDCENCGNGLKHVCGVCAEKKHAAGVMRVGNKFVDATGAELATFTV